MGEPGYSRPTLPFPAGEYGGRMARLARRMKRERLDALLVMTDISRYYLTGFACSNGILLLQPGCEPEFFTDFRYLEMARARMDFALVRPLGRSKTALKDAFGRRRWRRAGYEGAIPAERFDALRKAVPGAGEWVDGGAMLGGLRAVKSPAEQAALRRAVRAGDEVFRRVLERLRPGLTEWDIRGLIRAEADRASQGEAWDAVVCVGSNASRCHHHPTLRPLRPGQELLLDLGVKVDDYVSDMTRTVFCGEPTPALRRIYGIVLEANRRAIRAVRAGRTGAQVDAVARRTIEKAGYGRQFGHGLGHGIGLEVHEEPRLGPGSRTVLRPGMVVTIEPGVYLPGVGGVRIEDAVVVRRDGCEVLTATPKALLTFGQ